MKLTVYTPTETWVLRVAILVCCIGMVAVFVMGILLIMSFKDSNKAFDGFVDRCNVQEGQVYTLHETGDDQADNPQQLACIKDNEILFTRPW